MLSGKHKGSGFTLIELLIVVAIIAILAAIAVPNFVEAQLRSKVSRVKGDFRNVAVALEAYMTDYNHYPPAIGVGLALGAEQLQLSLFRLTTPTPYMSSVDMLDPFSNTFRIRREKNTRPIYMFMNYEPQPAFPGDCGASVFKDIESGARKLPAVKHKSWMLWSAGPDSSDNLLYWADWDYTNDEAYVYTIYDPTNGTVSRGDMGRMGGDYLAKKTGSALSR